MPEWIEIIPAGPRVEGRDGRWWNFNHIDDVIAGFVRQGAELVIDYEHATEIMPHEAAPAAGWITALENRGGALWAKVDWTERASAMIAAREYRFLSPVFLFDPGTMEIAVLISAALTHRPNLDLVALNTRHNPIQETPTMKDAIRKAICKTLGLKEEASDEAIQEAVDALDADKAKALNAAHQPSLEKFVPRADHDAVAEKLTAANARIAELETGDAEAAVDAAIEAGKIAPANRNFYLASAKNDRAAFDTFVQGAQVLPQGEKTKPGDPGKDTPALDADQRAICAQLGISEEEFAKDLAKAV